MKPRDIFTWKFFFYRALLPALRWLGPERADAVLVALGRVWAKAWPPRQRRLAEALSRAGKHNGGGADAKEYDPLTLAAGIARFRARDYLLDSNSNDEVLARFEVTGDSLFQKALAEGRGVILVGSHLGGHIAAFHWLYRRDVPLRLMVQRPRHVSRSLDRFFDRDEPEPQIGFFLRRSLEPTACVARLVRARCALRAGKAVYLPGDIPWSGSNTRIGRLLGQPLRVLSVWADLAVLTGAPVFHLFCTHRSGGRYALTLEPAGCILAGQQNIAISRYLARLESEITSQPGDAVAHLTWPCYGPPRSNSEFPELTLRPSRRVRSVLPASSL